MTTPTYTLRYTTAAKLLAKFSYTSSAKLLAKFFYTSSAKTWGAGNTAKVIGVVDEFTLVAPPPEMPEAPIVIPTLATVQPPLVIPPLDADSPELDNSELSFTGGSPVIHVGFAIDNDNSNRSWINIPNITRENFHMHFMQSKKSLELFIDQSEGVSGAENVDLLLFTAPSTRRNVLQTRRANGFIEYKAFNDRAWRKIEQPLYSIIFRSDPANADSDVVFEFLRIDGTAAAPARKLTLSSIERTNYSFFLLRPKNVHRVRKMELRDDTGRPEWSWYAGLKWNLDEYVGDRATRPDGTPQYSDNPKSFSLPGPPLYPLSINPMVVQNGRNSSVSLSPPNIPSFHATIQDRNDWMRTRKHKAPDSSGQVVDTDWPDMVTNDPVRIILESNRENHWLLNGVVDRPEFYNADAQWFIRMKGFGLSTLLTRRGFFNSLNLYGPTGYQDYYTTGFPFVTENLTVGVALERMFRDYTHDFSNIFGHYSHILDVSDRYVPEQWDPDNMPMRIGYWWAQEDNLWSNVTRLVATQGPPASFFENPEGRISIFPGKGSIAANKPGRKPPVLIGYDGRLQPAGPLTFGDHVDDIVNDAHIRVAIMGFNDGTIGNIRYDAATGDLLSYKLEPGKDADGNGELTVSFTTVDQNKLFVGGRDAMGNFTVGANFEVNNHMELFWYLLADGTPRTIAAGDNYEYRLDTGAPSIGQRILITDPNDPNAHVNVPQAGNANWGVSINKLSPSIFRVVLTNKSAGTRATPYVLITGTALQTLGTTEYWASETVRNEPATQASIRRHRYRLYNNTISAPTIFPADADKLADWVVRYYRDGLRTITLRVFVPPDHELEADSVKLLPLQPVQLRHGDYGTRTFNMLVRSAAHVFENGLHHVDLVLDEDIDSRVGLSPLVLRTP